MRRGEHVKIRRRGTALVLLTALLASCRAADETGSVLSTPTASPALSGVSSRSVVLYAMDGARPDLLLRFAQEGTTPCLATMVEHGVTAAYLQLVDPSLDLPSMVTLSTGAFPSDTGVVSDRVRVPGRPFPEAVDPLQQLRGRPEPLWRTAMRYGVKTAAVFWPALSLDEPELLANYVVLTAESDAPSAQHVVSLQEPRMWAGAPASVSPALEGSLRIASDTGGTLAEFNVLAVDQADDGLEVFDLLIVDRDRDLSNGYVEVPLGGWAAVTISPRLHSGTYFCFTSSTSLTATVYQSRVSYTVGRPDALVQDVNALGFPPPAADAEALRRGWLSAWQYYEMARERAEWMSDVLVHVYRTFHPTLLATSQSVISDCSPLFLSADGGGDEQDQESTVPNATFRELAYSLADRGLGKLLALVDLADSTVFVVSATPKMPVRAIVNVNTILNEAGLQAWSGQGNALDPDQTAAVAVASGGTVHIYLNLQGRDLPGVVLPDEYAEVQARIVDALGKTLGLQGDSVFGRILTHEALSGTPLNSPNTGDVFAQAAPGYLLSDEVGLHETVTPSTLHAAGGYAVTLTGMRGAFLAAGTGVASGWSIPAVQVTDIAPTIADLLHYEPPTTVRGSSIAPLLDR